MLHKHNFIDYEGKRYFADIGLDILAIDFPLPIPIVHFGVRF